MPQATDLVIKNAAAADKTFALIAPAAGDASIAKWALKEGTISTVFPTITAEARATGNQGRKVRVRLRIPSSYVETTTGLTHVGPAFEANVEVSVPDAFYETLKNDAVAYTANLVNTTLVKAMIRDALPAT